MNPWLLLTAVLQATATVIDTRNEIYNNKAQQMLYEEELRAKELAALDQENERLRDLRFANQDMLAHAGGVDAWASPSLLAARAFNFKMGLKDVENIRFNLMSEQSGVAARISVLKQNSRAAIGSSIFQLAGIAADTKIKHAMLKKGNGD